MLAVPYRAWVGCSPNPETECEQSDATERKWRSDFFLKSRSHAPFSPADRQRSLSSSDRTRAERVRSSCGPISPPIAAAANFQSASFNTNRVLTHLCVRATIQEERQSASICCSVDNCRRWHERIHDPAQASSVNPNGLLFPQPSWRLGILSVPGRARTCALSLAPRKTVWRGHWHSATMAANKPTLRSVRENTRANHEIHASCGSRVWKKQITRPQPRDFERYRIES